MVPTGKIGNITWHRIVEAEGPEFDINFLLPDAPAEAINAHRDWMEPRFLEPGTNKLIMATQSYLLRTLHHNILIDTCVGNDKERRFYPPWSGQNSTKFVDNLHATGLSVDDIDFVICTHLHADHVGWNTRLLEGCWVPTFPNARYVFAKAEYEFWVDLNKKGKKYSDGCIDDSVLPLVEAGLVDIVSDDYQFNESIWFERTPGHTPGHVSIRIRSNGANAIIAGDVLHTPLQLREPRWSAIGCSDRLKSAETRCAFLERYCETDTLIMPEHFPSPSVGYIRRDGGSYGFVFSD